MKSGRQPSITIESLDRNPVEQFRIWFREAVEKSGLSLPDAACLSTVDADGYPDGRMVLLKSFDDRGFAFYTNLSSRKAEALAAVPKASLTLYWEPLRRQVRIQGDVRRMPDEEVDTYFALRPRGSQLGAWASKQSARVADRDTLERAYREAEARFRDVEGVPRPSFWGGFRIVPRAMEFWQEGPHRLHDRFRYERNVHDAPGDWEKVRLYP